MEHFKYVIWTKTSLQMRLKGGISKKLWINEQSISKQLEFKETV